MKKLLILFLLLSAKIPVQAQACGGGTFTFEFYVINGEKPQDIFFEVLPVIIGSEEKFSQDVYNGLQVDSGEAVKMIDPAGGPTLDKNLSLRNNLKNGEMKNGILKFGTYETAYHPCLLKITSGKTQMYILANLTGGCNRTASILWGDNPRLSR